MPLDYVFIALALVVLTVVLFVMLNYYLKTNTWQVISMAVVIVVLIVAALTLWVTGSVRDPYFDEEPATTTAEEPVITTSPLTTSARAEPSTDESATSPPVREEKVSHVFMGEQFGLQSGAPHSLYLGEPEQLGFRLTNTDKERGYFMTTKERHRQGYQESLTLFTYVDVNGEDVTFSVDNSRIFYREANYHRPRMSISLEAGSDEDDVYGVTETRKQNLPIGSGSGSCELAVNPDNSDELTCTWHMFGMVHDTTIDRDMYELGLGHVLERGIGAVFIDLSEESYKDMTGEDSFPE